MVLVDGAARRIVDDMCRNITPLRGLDPPATSEEVESAARQYVRKVAAVTTAGQMASPEIERAIERIAAATSELLADLPARRRPPAVLPPLRRRGSDPAPAGA
jgi:hypothetical protein